MRLPAIAAVIALAACSPQAPETEQLTAVAPPEQPASAGQEEGIPAAYRGAAVAGQVCSQCHDIGASQPPTMNIGAPTFHDIATRPASTVEGLAAWMQANHPKMPNYLFVSSELNDLAAYIMSLREQPG